MKFLPHIQNIVSRSVENVEIPATPVPYQCSVIAQLEEEIKWQLQDEIVTALLDLEPIKAETLLEVTEHISKSTHKSSGQLDKVTLNFVYGPSESLGRFSQEFRKLPVPDYKLILEGDFYFLAKDYPTVSSSLVNTKKKLLRSKIVVNSPRGSVVEVSNPRSTFPPKRIEDQVYSEVKTLMVDILSEIEIENEVRRKLIYDQDVGNVSEPECDPNTQHDWLKELDKRRNILPNFWMIMKVSEDVVDVYFHCR